MIKLPVAELKQLVTLLERTSNDMHVVVREDGPCLTVQFQNADGQLSSVQLFDEGQRTYAKLTATEGLAVALNRLKAAKA
jgi:hypothetical protein